MNFQPFGATNAEGTCRWCGRAMPRPMDVERGPRRPPRRSKCHNAKVIVTGDASYTCDTCGEGVNGSYAISSRKPYYSKPGRYGDGQFCGLACGYQFGLALANGGRLLAPR
jgi:hypothetical protein